MRSADVQVETALHDSRSWITAQGIADTTGLPTGLVETKLATLVQLGRVFAKIRVSRSGAVVVFTDDSVGDNRREEQGFF